MAEELLRAIQTKEGQEGAPSASLVAALGGLKEEKLEPPITRLQAKAAQVKQTTKESMTLPDLFTAEEEQQRAEQKEKERSLLHNPKTDIPARQYSRMKFKKETLHRGAAFGLLRQQELGQRKAEEANKPTRTEGEETETQRKMQQNLERIARLERRQKQMEEQEDVLEDIVQNVEQGTTEKILDRRKTQTQVRTSDTKEKDVSKTTRKTLTGKVPVDKETEVAEVVEPEEEEEDDEPEPTTSTGLINKKTRGGCINPEQSLEFQNYLKDLVEVFVAKMTNTGSMEEPLMEMLGKIQKAYVDIEVFDRSAMANVKDIVKSIPDVTGLAWRKHLQGIAVLSPEDYKDIVEAAFSAKLAQDGHIMSKLEKQTFLTNVLTPEENEQVMAKCQELFTNVEEAHKVNGKVATNLKELAYMIKDPAVFGKITGAAMLPLVALCMPRLDHFINLRQEAMAEKKEKLQQRKSVQVLMEETNLPTFFKEWNENTEYGTRHLAAILFFLLKRKMTGAPPVINVIADNFSCSRSQLTRLIHGKKFKSGPRGQTKRKTTVKEKGESGSKRMKKEMERRREQQEDEDDEDEDPTGKQQTALEKYLLKEDLEKEDEDLDQEDD